jgi:hypothetical protein
MKLMRIDGDRIAEIVEVAGTVADLVEPASEAVFDGAGEMVRPAMGPTYQERPATVADYFHPDAGFVSHVPGVEVGFVRSGRSWKPPPADQPPQAVQP